MRNILHFFSYDPCQGMLGSPLPEVKGRFFPLIATVFPMATFVVVFCTKERKETIHLYGPKVKRSAQKHH